MMSVIVTQTTYLTILPIAPQRKTKDAMLIRRILIEPSTTCKVASWLLHCCDYRSALNLGKNAPYRPHRPCASQRHDILQVLSPRLLKKAAANSFASAALWMKLNREEADAVLTYAFRTSLGLVVPVTDNSSAFMRRNML